jgi:hypothetical protein
LEAIAANDTFSAHMSELIERAEDSQQYLFEHIAQAHEVGSIELLPVELQGILDKSYELLHAESIPEAREILER